MYVGVVLFVCFVLHSKVTQPGGHFEGAVLLTSEAVPRPARQSQVTGVISLTEHLMRRSISSLPVQIPLRSDYGNKVSLFSHLHQYSRNAPLTQQIRYWSMVV